MSLVIKAYLERNGEYEIRRFGIPADASASYTYVFKKTAEIFPGLVTGHFKLYWKDSDGDLVAFSSDEELIDALGFVTDAVFKIYIIAENEKKKPVGELHPRVICDGCNSAVHGVRFKCLVCPDYDLCSQCEARNTHPEHDMWKMVKPRSPAAGPMPFMVPPHFQRWMGNFMNRCQRPQPGGDASREGAPSGENNQNNPDAGANQNTTPQEEYLKNIGESVAAFLGPLGIDCQVDVEHNGQRQGVNGGGCQAFFENMMRQGFGACPFQGGSQDQQGTQKKETGQDKEKTPESGKDGKTEKDSSRSEDAWTLLSDTTNSSSSANHPDPRITEALQQMLLMGFNDDDGWLTRLIESKDGDISQVLDTIKPNKE